MTEQSYSWVYIQKKKEKEEEEEKENSNLKMVSMFMEALSTIAQRWKQLKYPSDH